VFAVVVVALAIGLRLYVVEPFYVPSGSMEPTLHGCSGCNDDRLLVDKLSYDLHGVRRGDVVVFRRPPGAPVTDAVLVKRVVGLAGESVSIHDGGVYIDGRRLSEPYVDRTCPGTVPETQPASLVVPRGDVYVMGDNRCNSTDSRTFGAIEKSSIIGRAFVIVWPLGRIHWL
jgi:signal peptidase I